MHSFCIRCFGWLKGDWRHHCGIGDPCNGRPPVVQCAKQPTLQGEAMRRVHDYVAIAGLTVAAATFGARGASAQDTIKVGLVMPMTGALAAAGRETVDGARLYMAQHGNMVAGKKIELIVKDDGTLPDNSKRLAPALIVNDKVAILGAGSTPAALAMAPIVTEGKIATVVMISGTSVVTERSPYYVRTSFTLGQQSGIMGDWAVKNGSTKAVSILSDFAP